MAPVLRARHEGPRRLERARPVEPAIRISRAPDRVAVKLVARAVLPRLPRDEGEVPAVRRPERLRQPLALVGRRREQIAERLERLVGARGASARRGRR